MSVFPIKEHIDVRLTSVAGCLGIAMVAVIMGTGVSAKVPTSRVTISGGHLSGEVDVVNRKALVNIWDGTRPRESWFDFPQAFIGPLASEPDGRVARYTVSFYADGFAVGRKLYVVRYVPDPLSGFGFIYLPLSTDPDGAFNGVVTRPGKDGHWLRASPEWSQALNAQIAAASTPSTQR